MKCSTIMYKISRSKLMKQLIKEVGNPDNYVSIYQQLVDLFSSYKGNRYNEETIKKILDLYLEKRNLKNINKVVEELELKREVREDNFVILEIKQNYEELNRKMIDLQELVLKSVEDNKVLRNTISNKTNNHRRIRHPNK